MLVTEQRTDAGDTSAADARPATPVRPRRVTDHSLDATAEDTGRKTAKAPASADAAEASSFEEYTRKMGAEGLEELLECAAAYTSFVEGHGHFSHPQIMQQVAELGTVESFTREDSLRSFGQLLRQGKIRKLSRGQFTLSQASRFTQEERRAML